MTTKNCNRCGETKPADRDHWYFKGDKPASGPCKECRKEMAKENYYKDPKTANERAKKYRQSNPEKIKQISKQWRDANIERLKEAQRQNYIANREERIAYERERRRKGIAAEQERARRAADPEKYLQKGRRIRKKRERLDPEYKEKRAAALRDARRTDPDRFRGYDAKRYADPKGNIDRRVNASIRSSLRKRGLRKTSSKVLITGWTIDQLMGHLEELFEDGMGWHNTDQWHIDHIIPLTSVKYESEDDPAFRMVWALGNLAPLWAKDNLEKLARLDWKLPDTYKNPKLRELYEDRDFFLTMFG